MSCKLTFLCFNDKNITYTGPLFIITLISIPRLTLQRLLQPFEDPGIQRPLMAPGFSALADLWSAKVFTYVFHRYHRSWSTGYLQGIFFIHPVFPEPQLCAPGDGRTVCVLTVPSTPGHCILDVCVSGIQCW